MDEAAGHIGSVSDARRNVGEKKHRLFANRDSSGTETADNNNEKRVAVSVVLRFARVFLPGDFVASGFGIRFGPALFFGFLFVKQFLDADIQQEKSKTPL
jgi:hypothetical protein